jgi:hypothetical protein
MRLFRARGGFSIGAVVGIGFGLWGGYTFGSKAGYTDGREAAYQAMVASLKSIDRGVCRNAFIAALVDWERQSNKARKAIDYEELGRKASAPAPSRG